MKTKLILLATIALLTLLLPSFTQAEILPQKVIAISDATAVERFYHQNINYKTQYTTQEFDKKFCSLNPQFFKKGCTKKAFKHLPSGKIWYFPALPESKSGQTLRQVYRGNKIYRILFPSFTKFQQEISNNNPEIKSLKSQKTNPSLKITPRPETYLIEGETRSSVTLSGKTFIKSGKERYYRLTNITQAGEIGTQKEGAKKTPLVSSSFQTNTNVLEEILSQTKRGWVTDLRQTTFLSWCNNPKNRQRLFFYF